MDRNQLEPAHSNSTLKAIAIGFILILTFLLAWCVWQAPVPHKFP